MGDRATLTGALSRGAVAGAAGTAVMTLSSTLEAKIRDRGASTTPAQAVEKVLDVEPTSEEAEQRLSNLAHWAYGTAWGAARGAIAALGIRGFAADASHLGVVWGAGLLMLPALQLAPPPKEWGAKELAIDLGHHAVYALAAGMVFRLLSRD